MENTRKASKRLWRIRGKYLSAYGEYGEFRVVCGIQNRLAIRGEYLSAYGEYAESIQVPMKNTRKASCRILVIRQET